MINVSGIDNAPALFRSSANAVSTPLAALAPPNSPTKNDGMCLSRLVDVLEDRVEPVRCGVLVAADIEIDQHCVPVAGDLGRAHVAHDCHLRQACDDVVDRGSEGGRARLQRAVLDQAAIAAGRAA